MCFYYTQIFNNDNKALFNLWDLFSGEKGNFMYLFIFAQKQKSYLCLQQHFSEEETNNKKNFYFLFF